MRTKKSRYEIDDIVQTETINGIVKGKIAEKTYSELNPPVWIYRIEGTLEDGTPYVANAVREEDIITARNEGFRPIKHSVAMKNIESFNEKEIEPIFIAHKKEVSEKNLNTKEANELWEEKYKPIFEEKEAIFDKMLKESWLAEGYKHIGTTEKFNMSIKKKVLKYKSVGDLFDLLYHKNIEEAKKLLGKDWILKETYDDEFGTKYFYFVSGDKKEDGEDEFLRILTTRKGKDDKNYYIFDIWTNSNEPHLVKTHNLYFDNDNNFGMEIPKGLSAKEEADILKKKNPNYESVIERIYSEEKTWSVSDGFPTLEKVIRSARLGDLTAERVRRELNGNNFSAKEIWDNANKPKVVIDRTGEKIISLENRDAKTTWNFEDNGLLCEYTKNRKNGMTNSLTIKDDSVIIKEDKVSKIYGTDKFAITIDKAGCYCDYVSGMGYNKIRYEYPEKRFKYYVSFESTGGWKLSKSCNSLVELKDFIKKRSSQEYRIFDFNEFGKNVEFVNNNTFENILSKRKSFNEVIAELDKDNTNLSIIDDVKKGAKKIDKKFECGILMF